MRSTRHPPLVHDYDIRWKDDGTVLLFSWYKGHAFEGWISQANFERAEADGVLSWDAEGNPIISAAAAPERRSAAPETRASAPPPGESPGSGRHRRRC